VVRELHRSWQGAKDGLVVMMPACVNLMESWLRVEAREGQGDSWRARGCQSMAL
jgi:hypothetical protein